MTVTHVLTHVFGGVHTAIFSLLREEFSLSLKQLGIIAAIPPLCQAIFTIPTGLLSDRLGSKRMLLISFAVAVAGALLASTANSPLVFILAISMVYINNAIYHPASYSYTANAFTDKERPKAMGLHGAGGTLGHATGPLAVSVLIGVLAFGWRQVYMILTVPILLGVVMVLRLKDEPRIRAVVVDEPRGDEDGGIAKLLTPNVVMFLLFRALASMGRSMISSFFVLYLLDVRGLTLALASFIFSSRMLLGLVATPVGGFMASRFGEKRWLIYTSAIGYACFGLSLFTDNLALFIALFMLYGFFNTVNMASRTSILARLIPQRSRGLGYSLFFLPTSIIGAVAPAIAGLIADLYGFEVVFYIAIAAYALAWVIMKFLVKVD
jgi:FSR family fosmidomycin resistance protein-like MFS transporter